MALMARFRGLLSRFGKNRLKNRDFTIISSSCWGAEAYRQFGIPYLTPFVGLFLLGPCYLRLLGDLKRYLSGDISFIDTSKYEAVNKGYRKTKRYPLGLLGGDVEIQFMHYSTARDAREKWKRRVGRINWDNIFVEFSERDMCDIRLIEQFDRMPFDRKVCFTARQYSQFKSTIWIEESRNDAVVPSGRKLYKVCRKYFNIVDWLNGGDGRVDIL